MLNFTRVRWIYGIILAIFFACKLWVSISFWWLFLLSICFGCLIAYGVLTVQSGFFVRTLNRAKTTVPEIALTFDDGPNAAVTPQLLGLLQEHNIKAAFFCIGKNIETSPEILRQMHEQGHVIANHTYTHDTLIDLLSAAKFRVELVKTEGLIKSILQKKALLFRPPYGITNPNISVALQGLGYTTIGWNIRSFDTIIKDNDKVVARITKRIKPGAIVLLHDNHVKVLDIVKKLIDHCSKNGIAFVRVDKLLNIQAYE